MILNPRFRHQILLWLARGALLWEQIWLAVWPLVAAAGLFIAIVLFDFLPHLPVWFHILILLAFTAAFALFVRNAWQGVRTVSEAAARHRLETDSGFKHRPLTALEDRLVGGSDDEAAQRLWAVHRERMARAVRMLRVALPSPGMARRDPLALRAVVLFLVVIAFAVGHRDAAARFERALLPSFERVSDAQLDISVWLTPPAYTGQAPVFFKWTPKEAEPKIRVPEGTLLLAQVAGVRSQPQLKVGEKISPFSAIDQKQPEKGHRIETTVEAGNRLAVEIAGKERAVWPLEVIADKAPTIDFTEPPQKTSRSQLQVFFLAEDDYGVSEIRLFTARADGKTAAGPAPGGTEGLIMPSANIGKKKIKSSSLQDLTAHPWAGQSVKLRLVVKDVHGQQGESKTIDMVLPERLFTHPVAQEIIAQRKKLIAGMDDSRGDVSAELDVIAGRPWRYREDTTVFLALRVAASRLAYDL
ncbi:MAG: DUF4175 family protein, partial [Rhodospirillales bacterium]